MQEPEEGTDRLPAGGEHRPARRVSRPRSTEAQRGVAPQSLRGPRGHQDMKAPSPKIPSEQSFAENDEEKAMKN